MLRGDTGTPGGSTSIPALPVLCISTWHPGFFLMVVVVHKPKRACTYSPILRSRRVLSGLSATFPSYPALTDIFLDFPACVYLLCPCCHGRRLWSRLLAFDRCGPHGARGREENGEETYLWWLWASLLTKNPSHLTGAHCVTCTLSLQLPTYQCPSTQITWMSYLVALDMTS